MDDVEQLAEEFKPHLIIAGGSAYPRDWDYKRFRQIADKHNAYLLADISHISALIMAGEMNNPFEHAHIVTSTTHKLMRGPRGGVIIAKADLMEKINEAVFPGLQGGPHNNQIAALAVQLQECNSAHFHDYARQCKANAKVFAAEMIKNGFKVTTDGTDCHLFLVDLRNFGLTGSKME